MLSSGGGSQESHNGAKLTKNIRIIRSFNLDNFEVGLIHLLVQTFFDLFQSFLWCSVSFECVQRFLIELKLVNSYGKILFLIMVKKFDCG